MRLEQLLGYYCLRKAWVHLRKIRAKRQISSVLETDVNDGLVLKSLPRITTVSTNNTNDK